MRTKTWLLALIALAALSLVVSCGGGSGGGAAGGGGGGGGSNGSTDTGNSGGSGDNGGTTPPPATPGPVFSGFDFSNFGFDSFTDDFDFGDIFEAFAGGGLSGFGRRGRRQGARGNDLRYDMEITLEEAAKGVEKTFTLTKLETCSVCGGNGAAASRLNCALSTDCCRPGFRGEVRNNVPWDREKPVQSGTPKRQRISSIGSNQAGG